MLQYNKGVVPMQITFTEAAIQHLEPVVSKDALLKLVFDSNGCGCAVNGVPALWVVPEADPRDLHAEASPFELVYSPKHEVFFEDHMKIDYQPENRSYLLKSNNQIYNAGMKVIDKR
jgi:uncharacterized protein YqkB